MSFIYENEKLLSELIKSVVDHEMKFNKRGQLAADPNINVEFRNYLTLTQKLVDQLRQQYFPTPPNVAEVTTGTGQQAGLGVPELSSLGNFLDYIVNNQIMVNGKRVAYGANEQNPDPRVYLPVTAEQIKFMLETETPQGGRAQFQADYYVSKDYLTQYITSLLADTSQRDDQSQRFLKTMLGARINDVNRLFHTNLTTDYKAPAEVLPDTTELDKIPNPVDPQNPYQEDGNVSLTVGDVKSFSTLRSWLMGKNMTMKTDDNKTAKAGSAAFDLCAFLSVLNARAANAARWAKAGGAQYQTQIQAIAKEAQCSLEQPGQGGAAGGQGGGEISPQILQQLTTLLPFNSANVNFREIQNFTNRYAPLARRSDITSMARQVNSSITEALSLMKQQSMIVPLEQMRSTNDLASWHAFAKDARLADVLYTIVNNAGLIYTDFVNTAKAVLGDQATLRNSQQVDDGGPWSVNMDDINGFRADLKEEAQSGGK